MPNRCKGVRRFYAFLLTSLFASVERYYRLFLLTQLNDHDPVKVLPPFDGIVKDKRKGFGACLMFKDDQDLLPEWLAYHFTILPLQHVVIGLDAGNSQDPRPILNLYKNSGLSFTIMDVPEVLPRPKPGMENDTQLAHHNALIWKQKLFVSNCTRQLQKMSYTWTALIDPDEYVSFNYIEQDEEYLQKKQGTPTAMATEMRSSLNHRGGFKTVLQLIDGWEEKKQLPKPACLTLPRLLVGALENSTCDNNELPPIRGVENLTTVRFVQHAPKGDFRTGRFGKVFVDLSKYPTDRLEPGTIYSIHRPSKDLCEAAFRPFPSSPLILQHYIGSWETYSFREDGRRSKENWKSRAYMNAGQNCRMREWLNFLEKEGDWEVRLKKR